MKTMCVCESMGRTQNSANIIQKCDTRTTVALLRSQFIHLFKNTHIEIACKTMQSLTEVSELEHRQHYPAPSQVLSETVPFLASQALPAWVCLPCLPLPHSPFFLMCPCSLTDHSNFFPFEISMVR